MSQTRNYGEETEYRDIRVRRPYTARPSNTTDTIIITNNNNNNNDILAASRSCSSLYNTPLDQSNDINKIIITPNNNNNISTTERRPSTADTNNTDSSHIQTVPPTPPPDIEITTITKEINKTNNRRRSTLQPLPHTIVNPQLQVPRDKYLTLKQKVVDDGVLYIREAMALRQQQLHQDEILRQYYDVAVNQYQRLFRISRQLNSSQQANIRQIL
eukprot:Tbor_TRINITY_DN5623_c0_g1::TRINITY_DN5623_c0_g1_i1::g.9135::m.9135